MHIGTVEIPSKLALAPMAGVTDAAFRQICSELGAGYTVTELISSKALCYHDKKTFSLLTQFPGEHPAAVQIFGSDPACMAEAAQIAIEHTGADILDINMGCPAKKVLQTACGSALMKDEALVARILEAVCAAVSVPVTLKIRTGWDREHRNALAIAGIAEQTGVAMLTIHGRTREDGFRGEAEYETIRTVKAAVSIPVIANGDIDSGEKARRVMALTGADGVMIGRASYGNPWIFSEVGAALGHLPERKAPGLEERHAVICDHMRRHFDYYGGARGAVTFRKHLSHYLKGLPGSEALLGELFATSDADVLGAAVSRYFERLQDDEQGLG